MIAVLGASAITLAALQATIAAPTSAFRSCLKTASTKATSEKVGSDAIDGYLRNACTVEMGTLKNAVVAFRVKNGMSKKAAADDAAMTVDDYVGTIVDNYQFVADMNETAKKEAEAKAQAQQPAAPPATAPATPAAQPAQQPPKA